MDIRRSHIIIALVVFTVLALVWKPDLLSTLCIIVFMGIVPGTDITIPSWVTLLGLGFALLVGIRWLMSQPAYHHVTTTQDRSQRHAARKRVLKQTTTRKQPQRRYKKQPVKV